MPLSKKLQELVDRITHQREKLFESVGGLTDAQLNYRSAEGEWSISDVFNHVSLTDEANAKLTSNFLKRTRTASPPPDPSPSDSVITSMDEIFPRMDGQRFQAPEFVAPHPHARFDESMARLKSSRERMLANIEQLDGLDLTGFTFPHPFAGPLNAYQWILLAGAHEARHAAQINRMKLQPNFPE